jgi:hypothetical protein
MRQPEIDAAAAEGKGRDLFATARAAHPADLALVPAAPSAAGS